MVFIKIAIKSVKIYEKAEKGGGRKNHRKVKKSTAKKDITKHGGESIKNGKCINLQNKQMQ